MKSTILALAALGFMAGTAHSTTLQCDRGAVFQTCNGAANNERPDVKRAPGDNGGSTGGSHGNGGGSTNGDDDNGHNGDKHNNNGFGNGDQDAPGNSGSHNNAENSGHQNHHGKH